MVHKHHYALFFFFSIFTVFFGNFLFEYHVPVTAILSSKKYVKEFQINITNPNDKIRMFDEVVVNEALILIWCQLYSNSTNNITLLIEPESEWNVTRIEVGIGHNINVTVTNGIVRPPPTDVAASFYLYILREDINNEVQGVLIVTILTRGWNVAEWPVVSVVLVLFLLYGKHRLKLRHKERE